jgi:hypothetical protein
MKKTLVHGGERPKMEALLSSIMGGFRRKSKTDASNASSAVAAFVASDWFSLLQPPITAVVEWGEMFYLISFPNKHHAPLNSRLLYILYHSAGHHFVGERRGPVAWGSVSPVHEQII